MTVERRTSTSWAAAGRPDISVHVATYRRASFLPDLVRCLEAQTLPAERFEVVVVDNGSGDDTWSVLCDRLERTHLRMAVLRVGDNRGPAPARNAAVAATSGELLAFTDDDCLPDPGWLSAMLAAAKGADVVQGRTEPDPAGGSGPWDRTIRIGAPTPLFETCNIVYRRAAFDRAGGFDERNAVSARPGGRAFGEDVLLGAAVLDGGGRRAFAPDAVVHHRCLPATYGDHLRAMRDLGGFPALANESKVLADALYAKVFLTSRTALFDLAVLSTVAALARRRPVMLAGAVPWVARTWPMTRAHGGRPGAVRLAQLGLADVVGAVALLQGSIRHRRFVL